MVRIGLFTDEPVVARGLGKVLGSESEFHLTCFEGPPEDLWVDVLRSEISVLLIDLSTEVPWLVLETLRQRAPACKVLLWVRDVSVQLAHQAHQLGVRGIVRKNLSTELLVRCLQVVSEGELWYERGLLQLLHDAKTVKLTPREQQLLTMVGRGLANKEIAYDLGLTEGTIKFYMSRLFKKMGVSDRFELALYGLQALSNASLMGRSPATDWTQGPQSIVLQPQLRRSA